MNYPGVYPIHPFSTIITGLYQAGGIDTSGSLRNIQIKRNGVIYKDVDLYDYFIKGESSSIIQLRDQDIIVIPPRFSTVFIDSAVNRPGIYESAKDESIYDMINYAGGLTYTASSIIELTRLNSNHKNITPPLYFAEKSKEK